MSSVSVVHHAIVLSVRISLFIFCRKFLLDALYRNLRSLSYAGNGPMEATQSDLAHPSDNEMELEGLPRTVSSRNIEGRPKPAGSMSTSSIASFARGIFPQRHDSNSSVQANLARSVFALCFEEGCILFLLVMCQALNILDGRTRRTHWIGSLFVLVFLVIVFIPLVQCLLFTYRAGSHTKSSIGSRIVYTGIPFLLYLFAFSYVPLPRNLAPSGIFTNAVARMTVLGTLILGLLSGFGAVSTAWSFQPFVDTSNIVTEKDVNQAAASLARVRADLVERQREAQQTESSEPSSGWFPTNFFKQSASSAIHQEISGMMALESQMARNLESLQARRAELQFRETWKGRIFVAIGKVFAIYCVFRIISSIRNVIFGPSAESGGTSSPDIITYLLARFFALFPDIPLSQQDVASLSRQISLLLVGCIILGSVRTVLRQVGGLLKLSSRTIGAAFLLLFLAQLMGTYLLSTLIQLRTSFPPVPEMTPLPPKDNAQPIQTPGTDASNNLFSSLPEYQLFGVLFDGSFLAAAVVTGAMIWAHRKIHRAEIFT